MKTNAIISAIICFVIAVITLITAIAQASLIGFCIGILIALIGWDFYRDREEAI